MPGTSPASTRESLIPLGKFHIPAMPDVAELAFMDQLGTWSN